MTPEEFYQLKAFARQDGALLSLLWISSFACYILGIATPMLGTVALMLILASPFFAANRLRHFRDGAREGIISFRRGYAYTALVFFYAAILLAAATYIYFAFIDTLLNDAIKMTPEVVQALNELCAQGNVSGSITRLQNAEEALQKMAYDDMSGTLDYLYRFAYELKLMREQFENLENILGYEPDRD